MTNNCLLLLSAVFLGLAGLCQGQLINCDGYNPDGPCTMDLIPFCLTNGTTVSGRCAAMRAVCQEGVPLDETFSKCTNRKTNFDCTQYNELQCAKDAIPFCLHNGTLLRGSCAAKKAVCVEGQTIDDDFAACNKVPDARMSDIDCTAYDPMKCTKDAKLYCLTNGTTITGSCYAKKAVCVEGQTVDKNFVACGPMAVNQRAVMECANYDPLKCTKDAIPHCLNNGTTVIGKCAARKAVCLEGKMWDNSGLACQGGRRREFTGDLNNDNGNNGNGKNDDGSNHASALSATASLFLALLVSTRL